jgi:hypothetical protein
MVSHFEQETDEYQEYQDDDEGEEIAEASTSMVNPIPSTSIARSLKLERYKPQAPERRIAEVYEIDSDLSQVFNTLNVTYK